MGILGCADEEVYSFRLLRVPAYKVPAVCKAGVFYFFIKAVSVITVLVQVGARKQKYRVSTVHGKIYAAIHTYAVGDLGGKLVGVLRIRPVPPKNFYFLCFAPLQEPENFGSPCSADGARRKRFSGARRRSILPKFSEPCKGKQKIKLFWKRPGGRDSEENGVQKSCRKSAKKQVFFRSAGERRTQEKPHYNRVSCHSAVLLCGSGKGIRTLGLQCHKLTR